MNSFKHYFTILLFLGISFWSKSQCTFSLGPDLCKSAPINFLLNGPAGYNTYSWSTGSKNPNITITAAGTYICTATKMGTDLVVNGDFTAGNTGFSSAYDLGQTGPFGPLSNEGTYYVSDDPSKAHSHFTFFGDHTSGKGNMLFVNGNPVSNASIWCQSIPVTPNTPYNFSTWVATCNAASKAELAQLQFSINGALIGSVFSPGLTVGVWSQFNATWNSGNNTTANICIVNKNTTLLGNDFALDDIFLQAICTSTDTVKVFSSFTLKANAGPDQTVCVGSTVKLSAVQGNGSTGSWSGGTGTFVPGNNDPKAVYKPSIAEESAGTVTLKYTLTSNSQDCPGSDTDEMTITIGKISSLNAGPDQTICIGSKVQLAAVLSGTTSGKWSGGSGSYSPNSNAANAIYTLSKSEEAAGKVVLVFTSNDPPGLCPVATDTMVITIDQLPEALAGDSYFICEDGQISLRGKVRGAALEGIWSGGNGAFVPNNKALTATYSPTLQEIEKGKVTLRLTTIATGVCPVDADSVTIAIYHNPVVQFSVDTPKACPGHCVDFFDSTKAKDAVIVKWDWDYGIKGSTHGTTKNPKEVCYNKPGLYDVTLTATTDKGCVATATKQLVETYKRPVANFTATPNIITSYDPMLRFFDQSTPDVIAWTWDFGDRGILSQTKDATHQFLVDTSGYYIIKLFVANKNGCKDTTEQEVEIRPDFAFYMPNAFTPDADGINDTFFGKGVGIAQYHLWIFNRWGDIIFTTTDMSNGWNGHANNGGEIASQDVYVWKVELKDILGKKHAYIGTVTLTK